MKEIILPSKLTLVCRPTPNQCLEKKNVLSQNPNLGRQKEFHS